MGGYQCCLLVVKAKVSAMWSTSTSRVEMDGAVLVVRLVYRAVKSFNPEDVPERVWIIGDSETVLACSKKDLVSLGNFSGTG